MAPFSVSTSIWSSFLNKAIRQPETANKWVVSVGKLLEEDFGNPSDNEWQAIISKYESAIKTRDKQRKWDGREMGP